MFFFLNHPHTSVQINGNFSKYCFICIWQSPKNSIIALKGQKLPAAPFNSCIIHFQITYSYSTNCIQRKRSALNEMLQITSCIRVYHSVSKNMKTILSRDSRHDMLLRSADAHISDLHPSSHPQALFAVGCPMYFVLTVSSVAVCTMSIPLTSSRPKAAVLPYSKI